MAIWWVRPDATGDDNGTDWNNAWVSIASAMTKSDYTKGDVIYLHGTENYVGGIINGAVNTHVQFIAVNELGIPTPSVFYTIDGTGASSYLFQFSSGGAQRRVLRNILFRNFSSGVMAFNNTHAGSPYFHNCYFVQCGVIVAGGAGAAYPSFYSCVFWLCTTLFTGAVNYVTMQDCVVFNCTAVANGTGSLNATHCFFSTLTNGITPATSGTIN